MYETMIERYKELQQLEMNYKAKEYAVTNPYSKKEYRRLVKQIQELIDLHVILLNLNDERDQTWLQ